MALGLEGGMKRRDVAEAKQEFIKMDGDPRPADL